MRQEDRLQLIWAGTFIMSGVIFALAFMFTPVIGTLAAAGYIVMYVGLSMAFLLVFRNMTKLNTEFLVGMGKHDDQFIMILNIDKVFTLEELSAVQNAA